MFDSLPRKMIPLAVVVLLSLGIILTLASGCNCGYEPPDDYSQDISSPSA